MRDIAQRINKETDLLTNDAPAFFENLIENPADFLTWEDVENCMNNTTLFNFEVIGPDNKKIEVPRHSKSWVWDRAVQDKKFLFDRLHEGAGLICLDYAFYNQKTNDLCRMFEENFSINAAIHVYCGLGGSKSFNIHEDYPANFIIQCEGETRWQIFNNRVSYMHKTGILNDRLKENDLDKVIDVVLKPGDAIYIPSRMYHCAYPEGKRLSMSIPCWQKLPTEGPEGSIDRNRYRINTDV